MKTNSFCSLALLSHIFAMSGLAAEDDLRDKLDKMPQPWRERVHRLTVREYEATLNYWQKRFPDKLTVESLGIRSRRLPSTS